jgi:hypothetical protein
MSDRTIFLGSARSANIARAIGPANGQSVARLRQWFLLGRFEGRLSRLGKSVEDRLGEGEEHDVGSEIAAYVVS